MSIPERDYLSEVSEEVAKYLDSHDHIVSAEAAEELLTRWEAEDTDLMAGWLHARARQILRDYIYNVSLSRGARRPREEQHARFAKFSAGFNKALEDGAENGREFYRYHSVTEGPLLVRKPLGAMNARQVGEVRDRYRQASRDNAFYARVLEAVRKKVADASPEAVVSDIYTPEQLENMFTR